MTDISPPARTTLRKWGRNDCLDLPCRRIGAYTRGGIEMLSAIFGAEQLDWQNPAAVTAFSGAWAEVCDVLRGYDAHEREPLELELARLTELLSAAVRSQSPAAGLDVYRQMSGFIAGYVANLYAGRPQEPVRSEGKPRIVLARAGAHAAPRRGAWWHRGPAPARTAEEHPRLRRPNRDLAQVNVALLKANQTQSDLIALLAHDTRQPLTIIQGYLEMTIEGWATTSDEVKLQHLETAARATRAMGELVDDILALASFDSGATNSRAVRTLVADVVAEAVVNSADSRGIGIKVDGVPAVLVDPWQLRQIITNLIGNATKYGRPPITVEVGMVGQSVTISVYDSGDGVPADFVEHLFERFNRGASGSAHPERGTGFGLYIVGRLVEANHGTVSYRRNAPTGAVFTVVLPRASADQGGTW